MNKEQKAQQAKAQVEVHDVVDVDPIYITKGDKLDIHVVSVGAAVFLNDDCLGALVSMDMNYNVSRTEISYIKAVKEGEPLVRGKIIAQHHPRNQKILKSIEDE